MENKFDGSSINPPGRGFTTLQNFKEYLTLQPIREFATCHSHRKAKTVTVGHYGRKYSWETGSGI